MRQISPYQGRESLWDFMSEVERAFDEVWQSPTRRASVGGKSTNERFVPAVDLHETKDFYLVSMDLPGVPEKDIKIDVQDGRLTVSGERVHEAKQEEGMFRRYERTQGSFARSFSLPQDVNQEGIQARYEHGVLEVMIPKAEVTKARTIAINKEKGGGLFSRLLGQKDVKASEGSGSREGEKH